MLLPSSTPEVAALSNDSALEVSIVVPTYNERDNIQPMIARVARVMSGLRWEMIFVDDDSPDDTAEAIRTAAGADARIRLIHRIGRRGLSSACIEGMSAAFAPVIAVMDADLQHDESILPQMIRLLHAESLELVVGTRHAEGGSMGDFSLLRVALSQIGKKLSRLISCTPLSDPMSGFFIVDRRFFREVAPRLDGRGFKILLDLLASSCRRVRVGEVGYRFRNRTQGESKLGSRVLLEFLLMVAKSVLQAPLRDPATFASFAADDDGGVPPIAVSETPLTAR